MDNLMRQRGVMALTGALLGAGLYGLAEVLTDSALPDRLVMAIAVLAAVFSAALLSLVGPLRLTRAALWALVLGAVMALLLVVGSLRFALPEDFLGSVHPLFAAFAVAFLPLPFLIAAAVGPDWRDYTTLFAQSWALVVRALSAVIFAAIVWAVIGLSHLLFGLVGLTVIEDVLSLSIVPWVITGAALGLSLAVVVEMADVLSPALVLRLLRLLLIPVLVVLVVFLVALPLNGMAGFAGLSAAVTLLVMTAGAVTLVTTAVDRDDTQAVQGRVMHRSAQAMALLLPVPAALAGWAVWLRVADYGWTPERLFAAVLTVIGLGYGLAYAGAVLRGSHWMARIRRANVTMALVVLGLAALWLAVVPAEWLSARDQMARFAAGQTPVEALDVDALSRWGKAGAAARAELDVLAQQPGQDILAARLAGTLPPNGPLPNPELLDNLKAAMPVQPAGAEATRDLLLAGLDDGTLDNWLTACRDMLEETRPGCVFVVGDFLPRWPGEEGLVIARMSGGWVDLTGLAIGDDGQPRFVTVASMTGTLPQLDEGEALLRRMQDAPPALTPAPVNRIDMGGPETGIVLLP